MPRQCAEGVSPEPGTELMRGHGRPALVAGAALLLASACQSTEDPFTSGPSGASVAGLVTGPGGTPLSATTVHISCAGGGAPVDVATDAAGHYGANLESGPDPFDGGYGRLSCRFAEPATGPARVQIDTTLGFVRGPVLRVQQIVNLREE